MSDHKCDFCLHNFATCLPEKVVFGIDVNPEARGAEADKVVECSMFEPTTKTEALREEAK